MNKSVPLEIAEQITMSMALEDLTDKEKMAALFPHLDLSREISLRSDVDLYLSRFVDDVEDLMKTMLVTNSYIYGLRALDFFLPNVCDGDTEWDIVCCGNSYDKRLLLERLKCVGFECMSSRGSTHPSMYGTMPVPEKWRKRVGSDKYSVTLVTSKTDKIVHEIIDMPISAIQCYIAGYGAVSVMSKFTKRRDCITWNHANKSRHNFAYYMELLENRDLRFVSLIRTDPSNDKTEKMTLDSNRSFIMMSNISTSGNLDLAAMCSARMQFDMLCSWTQKAGDIGPCSTSREIAKARTNAMLVAGARGELNIGVARVTGFANLGLVGISQKGAKVARKRGYGAALLEHCVVKHPATGLPEVEEMWLASPFYTDRANAVMDVKTFCSHLKLKLNSESIQNLQT